MTIEVTQVEVTLASNSGFIGASARVILGGVISVRGFTVVHGKCGPFVSFPRAYDPVNRVGHDVVNVMSGEIRSQITRAILNDYQLALAASSAKKEAKPEPVNA